ncbi:ATP-binding/permease protein CydD [bioreactor metagenome]|uniref:ATP-binding/permease protein CydD n=1 Tax=bioreactor metagenome TaxID=1076179 RepID=A0A644TLQ7_9ZZZZ|nr:thiol reductant ABC exporter subunit CydD [Negativicutes bacterium]
MLDKRLLRQASGQGSRFAALIGLGLTGAVFAVLQAGFITKIINGVFLEGLDLPDMSDWLAFLLVVIVSRAIIIWITGLLAHSLAVTIKAAIRKKLVEQVFAAGPVRMGAVPAGDLTNTIVQGIENLEAYFSRYIPQLAAAVLIPVFILCIAVPLDMTSAAIMMVTAPLIPVFMALIGQMAERRNKQQWDKLSRLSAHFLDVLRGLSTLKMFGRSKEQAAVIARMSADFRETTLGVLKIAFLSSLVLELFTTISIALIAVSVGLRLLYGQMDFNNAFFLLLLAPEFYLPLRQLGSHFHAGMAGTAAAESIFPLLTLATSEKADNEYEKIDCQDGIGARFNNVCYTYQGGGRAALDGLSFEIKTGTKVALVGPSGAGKSTVINLLLGFVQADSGAITVNGVALDRLNREEWLANIAYVPQFPHLFYGTIADNIRLGKQTADMTEIIAAAQAAGAHDFIDTLPDGYQTIVGEGGHGLSGGQRQRLAIARAFLRDAPFLILDEATASLDPYSEEIVQQAIERLMAGRTVLVAAHRLTTVTHADRIIVLDKGQAVEQGTHAELLAQKGLYATLLAAFASEV